MQAHFSHPMVAAAVIIHLAADGTSYIDQTQCNITVQLVDTNEGNHSLGINKSSQQLHLNLILPHYHDIIVVLHRRVASQLPHQPLGDPSEP